MEVAEFRHLEEVRINFEVADRKEGILYDISVDTDPSSQVIVTSVKRLVETQQYIFENL